MALTLPDCETLVRSLQLEPHIEGGYFKRTFQADHRDSMALEIGERLTLSSIYYLLSSDSPIGHWHLNYSDIIHYYHLGSPLNYYMIGPDGGLETAVLGPDIAAGQQLQLAVSGGTWKASQLPDGDYGLISEAVSPGFDAEDMTLGDRDTLLRLFPQHQALIKAYSR